MLGMCWNESTAKMGKNDILANNVFFLYFKFPLIP